MNWCIILILLTTLFVVNVNGFFNETVTRFKDAVDSKNLSAQCKRDFDEIVSNPKLLINFLDASAMPLGNGLLWTSNVKLGNMDECLSIEHKYQHGIIHAKHCTPLIVLPYTMLPFLEIREGLTYMMLSGCIPKSCATTEAASVFLAALHLEQLQDQFNMVGNCVDKDTGTEISKMDIAVSVIFSFFLAFMVLSTIYDLLSNGKKHPVLVAFSVYTNVQKLLVVPKSNREQLQMFHGIRFISMMWIIAGHGMVAWLSFSLTNAEKASHFLSERYSQYISTAPLAVDTFFFLSGFLLAFQYLKQEVPQPAIQQIAKVPYLYFHRYLRLTPALLMVYLVSISIYRHFGTGPMYDQNALALRQPCVDHWWAVFLYIQNYYNYDNICLTQTWYLAADMQMFIVSPLIVIPMSIYIRKKYKIVMSALMGLNIFFYVLPMIVKFLAESYPNAYDTHSRLIDYSMGLTLGAFMRVKIDKPFAFSMKTTIILWILAIGDLLATILLYQEVMLNGNYDSQTVYYSTMRPLWCLGLSWVVYACYHGKGGIINAFLTMPFFQIFGKLTYCMYLVHGSIIAYIVLITRTELHFSDFEVFYMYCGHFILTLVISTIWTLAFESPIIIIEKYIFGSVK